MSVILRIIKIMLHPQANAPRVQLNLIQRSMASTLESPADFLRVQACLDTLEPVDFQRKSKDKDNL